MSGRGKVASPPPGRPGKPWIDVEFVGLPLSRVTSMIEEKSTVTLFVCQS